MAGLVVFLHGLGGDEHSWHSVPDEILKSLEDFQIATPAYSATLLSQVTVEMSARQIITFVKTNYPANEPIVLVGYSLGGLVAREICRLLLVDGEDALINKISTVMTFGTPLEGARIGNIILRKIPFTKLNEISNARKVFDSYRAAIRSSRGRKIRRPKLLHVLMEDDRVIGQHQKAHYTDDDSLVDVIDGGHRHFAERNEDAKFIADVLLRHIQEAINSASRPNIQRPPPVEAADLPDRLIILACSHGKQPGGRLGFGNVTPARWMPALLKRRVIAKRSYIYNLVRDAKLEDGFEKGGVRAYQPANIQLKFGPDLGGASVPGDEGTYLAAAKRYTGRIYGPITAEAWHSANENRARVRILIMSGLYGLLEPDEEIQNYDVHLTDTNKDGISVSSMWLELFTETIKTYVEHAYRGRKVKIFNFLCDKHYVDAIKWHALPRECSVYHFSSPTLEDIHLLSPAGIVIDHLLKNLDQMDDLERDDAKTYPLTNFGVAPVGLADTEVLFESRVGLSKSAPD